MSRADDLRLQASSLRMQAMELEVEADEIEEAARRLQRLQDDLEDDLWEREQLTINTETAS